MGKNHGSMSSPYSLNTIHFVCNIHSSRIT